MIESGSHTPGVDPADFALHADTALRYERPDPALEGLIGDYFVFDSQGRHADGAVEWMLPNWPVIRFVLADRPITVETPAWHWTLLEAGFYGTTSRAMKHTSHGGVTIGLSLTPAGIARLLDIDVSHYRDRMVPLADLLPPADCAALVAELRASDRGPAVKAILDRFFRAHMARAHPAEPEIAALNRLLLDDRMESAADLARELGMPLHTLRRLARRRFGFPPKLLLMRTRFLRSLIALKETGATQGYQAIDAAYTDASHFLRDSERFLGMTARRFLKIETPFLDSALRARKIVLGAATAALAPPESARPPESAQGPR